MTTKHKKEPQHPKPLIQVSINGPYLISGNIPLLEKIIQYDPKSDTCEWEEGKTFPRRKTYALCRCGHSHTKPFCDEAHIKINFDGTETANRDPYLKKAVETVGPNLRLTDEQDLCASARFCHRAGGIWSLIPTAHNPDDRRIAIEEAADCPSSRLVVYEKESGKPIEPTFEPSLVLIEDAYIKTSGPLWVRGGIPITSSDDIPYEIRNRVTLYRCGKSQKKPFCDSNHVPE